MKRKRLLCIMIAVVMFLTTVVSVRHEARADETTYSWVSIGNAADLKLYLGKEENYSISIANDIDFHENGDYAYWCTVSGKKLLNLNGHRIRIHNDKVKTSTLFRIPAGTVLTIVDNTHSSPDKVGITYNGYIDSNGTVRYRNLFEVSGTLLLQDGSLEAGRSKKEYIASAIGYYWKQTHGCAVVVKKGGTFTMCGGVVYGRGIDCAAIRAESGSNVYINHGGLRAKGEASVFDCDVSANVYIAGCDINISTVLVYAEGYVSMCHVYGVVGISDSCLAPGAGISPVNGLKEHDSIITPGTGTCSLSVNGTSVTNGSVQVDEDKAVVSVSDQTDYFKGIPANCGIAHFTEYKWTVKDGDTTVATLTDYDKPSVDIMKDFTGFKPEYDHVYTVNCDTLEKILDVDTYPRTGTPIKVSVKKTTGDSTGKKPGRPSEFGKFKKENGKWYYVDSLDKIKTGKIKVEGIWYFFDDDGVMLTGWQFLDGKWYFYNTSGAMQTGWKKVNGKWYFFDESGVMQTGWLKDGGKWYYLNKSGAMVTGWQTIENKTYYFKPSGVMAANEWCKGWWLNKDGSWTWKYKGSWKHNSKGWWFGDTSGWYAKNQTLMIDDVNYTFDKSGYRVE